MQVDLAVPQIDPDIEGRPAPALDLPFLSAVAAEVFRGDRTFIFGYPGIGDGFLVFTEGTAERLHERPTPDRRATSPDRAVFGVSVSF